MTSGKLQCPKCKGEMVQGFVPDYFYYLNSAVVASWQEGPPKKPFLTLWNGAKAPLKKGVPIGAFRCQKCGFLEFYADPKFATS